MRSMKRFSIVASLTLSCAACANAATNRHSSTHHAAGSSATSHNAASLRTSSHRITLHNSTSSASRTAHPALREVRYARPAASSAAASASASSAAARHRRRVRRGRHSHFVPLQQAPSSDRITEIQSALARGGYYQGDPTGKWDDSTVSAMEKFQSANGIEPNGKIDAPSLQKLGLGSDIAGVSAPRPVIPAPTSSPSTSLPAAAVPGASAAMLPTAASSSDAAGSSANPR
jgi:murein L,D-transpeptidase YcbB/YkuD